MEIVDDFLDQAQFNELQTIMMGDNFAWFYNDKIDFKDDENKWQFIHGFYFQWSERSPFLQNLNPILKIIKPMSILTIKANLLTKTPKIVENKYHHDISNFDDENKKTIFPEKLKLWTTSILYMNTNNGYTKFEDGSIVESVANRMVTFPSNVKHTGTSCTDQNTRVVINFNYFI